MTEHKDMCETLTAYCTKNLNGLPPLKNCKVVADENNKVYVLQHGDDVLCISQSAEAIVAHIAMRRLFLATKETGK